MSVKYADAELTKLLDAYAQLDHQHLDLTKRFLTLNLSDEAMYFVRHGFMRRVATLKRCIENVYLSCPPDQEEPVESDALKNIDINLQAMILNAFGALDNLAWIWVSEKKL